MKFLGWAVMMTATLALAGSATDVANNVTGTWKAVFVNPERGPKMFAAVVLNLEANGEKLTGMCHAGNWPGDAPITNGKVDGDRISFTVIGKLPASTGLPKMTFTGTRYGKLVDLEMVFEGLELDGRKDVFDMVGKKTSEAR
jgi:hypothetical protein